MDPFLGLAAILVLGIGAQWLAWAIRLPSILLLLALGLLLGPVFHLIVPGKLFGPLLLPVVSLSVGIILFEGGLSLKFKDVRSVGYTILALVTVGMLLGFALVAAFLHYVLDYGVGFSLLQSAILTVTGPTVIGPMLSHLRIKEPVASILHWEGIVIDPLGAVLAVLVFEGLIGEANKDAFDLIIQEVFVTFSGGLIAGIVGGFALRGVLKRFWMPDQLQNPLVLMFVVLFFALAETIHSESGLISVTCMGVLLANQSAVQVRHIIDFKESLRVILIAILFILLASTVDIKDLIEIWDEGLFLLLFLILIARPLTALISTLFSSLSWKETAFIASLAPRGIIAAAISSLFGLRLIEAGFNEGGELAPLTFAIIAGTVLIYGIGAPFMARRLGMVRPPDQGVLIIGANPVARAIGEAIDREGFKVHMIDSNYWKFADAKLSRIPVQHGNLFTLAEDEEALQGIGKLLALTSNDQVNSLACLRFAEQFGKANLFQLPFKADFQTPADLRGRILFTPDLTYDEFNKKLDQGWVVKATNITEEFTFEKWKAQYEGKALLLFTSLKKEWIHPATTEAAPSPKVGGKVIFLAYE